MKNKLEACRLAVSAFDNFVEDLDEMEDEDEVTSCISIAKLLKANVTLWKEEQEKDTKVDDL